MMELTRLAPTAALSLSLLLTLSGCMPDSPPAVAKVVTPAVNDDSRRYTATEAGLPFEGKTWISHVNVVDLDQDERPDHPGV